MGRAKNTDHGPRMAGLMTVALLGLLTPAGAAADSATPLWLQSIRQETQGGCADFPELNERLAAELKQLTGRPVDRAVAMLDNPTVTKAGESQVFGGYVEPLDNGWWRARLWLKEAHTAQVAVRDGVYRTAERLAMELPLDAAALILLPDWSRAAPAVPLYCSGQVRSGTYPDDACDPFFPPPSCGVPFDCAPGDQGPRCSTGPTCGVPGKPPCAAAGPQCRVRDWRVGTGITALVVGGVAIAVGGLLHYASLDGRTPASDPSQKCGGGGYPTETGSCYFNGVPAAVTSYVVGGALLGAGAGLLGHFGLHAQTVPCKKGK